MKKAILFALTTIASLGAFAQDAEEAAKAAKQAVLTAAAAGPHSGLVAIAAAIAVFPLPTSPSRSRDIPLF